MDGVRALEVALVVTVEFAAVVEFVAVTGPFMIDEPGEDVGIPGDPVLSGGATVELGAG